MQVNNSSFCRIRLGRLTLKKIALFSIMIYLILSTVFEESHTGLSKLASIGIIFCIVFCGLYVIVSRRIKFEKWILTLLLFGLVLIVSVFYSPTSSRIITTYIYRYWSSWILLLLVSNVIQDDDDIRFIIRGYIYAGMILAIYIYIFYGIKSLVSMSSRLTNEIANQNSIGICCACSFIFSVMNFTITSNKSRYFYLIPIALTLPACLFSGSRKSIIMLLLTVFIFFLLYSENRQTIKRLLLGGIIIGGIIYIIQNVPAFNIINSRFGQFFSVFNGNNSLMDSGDINRIKFIETGFDSFKSSPVWGNGFAYSYYVFGTYSHNNYIELLMNNGILGFLIYYSIHIFLIVSGFKTRVVSKKISSYILSIIFIVLFVDIGSVNYYSRYFLILLCLAFKLLSIRNIKSENQEGI